MLIIFTLFVTIIGSVVGQDVINHPRPQAPRNLEARQTSDNECATAIQPLFTNAPIPPPEFTSFWANNNPMTKGCLPAAPSSLGAQFSSVYDEYASWFDSVSSSFSSIASKCPEYNFGSLGAQKRDISTPTYAIPSIPSEFASWTNFNFETGIPVEWAQYLSAFRPCSTTTGGPDSPANTAVASIATASSTNATTPIQFEGGSPRRAAVAPAIITMATVLGFFTVLRHATRASQGGYM